MDKILEIVSLKVIFLSILIALCQNILVDIFKSGDNTNFKNIGIKSNKPYIINRILFFISTIIGFTVLYFSELLDIKEVILTSMLSAPISYLFYKTNIYTRFMEIIFQLKNSIIFFIKKRLGG